MTTTTNDAPAPTFPLNVIGYFPRMERGYAAASLIVRRTVLVSLLKDLKRAGVRDGLELVVTDEGATLHALAEQTPHSEGFAVAVRLDAPASGNQTAALSLDALAKALNAKDGKRRPKDVVLDVSREGVDVRGLNGITPSRILSSARSLAQVFPPTVGTSPSDHVANVSSSSLARAVAAVIPFTDDESTRYALGSVCFAKPDAVGPVEVVATDSRSLALVELGVAPQSTGMVLAPTPIGKRAASLLQVLAADEHGDVGIFSDGVGSLIGFDCRGFTLTVAPETGRFPRYRDVIPTEHSVRFDFGTSGRLLEMLRLFETVADAEDGRTVDLDLPTGEGVGQVALTLENTLTTTMGTTGVDTMPLRAGRPDVTKIVFDAFQLRRGVDALGEGASVLVDVTSDRHPVTIHDGNGRARFVVMPCA